MKIRIPGHITKIINNRKLRSRLLKIKIIAMDIDGVLTDGGMYYGPNGECLKKYNTRDGKAIELLKKWGMIIAVISGEKNKAIIQRMRKLNINNLYLGCNDKLKAARDLLNKYKLGFENMLYVGDDWGDTELLKDAGFSCVPSDAMPWAVEAADFIISRRGGQGVIPEVLYLLNLAKNCA